MTKINDELVEFGPVNPRGEMLKVPEAAAQLGINREVLRRWLRVGKVRGWMIGGRKAGYRIPQSEIDRILHRE